MMEDVRRLPPSMVTIGIVFVSLFVVLGLGTIVAVVADGTPEPPSLEGLPLVASADVIDTISTCTESACDGLGVVLQAIGVDATELTANLVNRWDDLGWAPMACVDEGRLCFADDDLRISVHDWDSVDPLSAPTLVEGVLDRGLEPDSLLYLHYFRCGAIYPCN